VNNLIAGLTEVAVAILVLSLRREMGAIYRALHSHFDSPLTAPHEKLERFFIFAAVVLAVFAMLDMGQGIAILQDKKPDPVYSLTMPSLMAILVWAIPFLRGSGATGITMRAITCLDKLVLATIRNSTIAILPSGAQTLLHRFQGTRENPGKQR
jgi:hypothetical protein